jgi:hypothetical protein
MKKRTVICKDFNVQMNTSDFFHLINNARYTLWTRRHPGVKKFNVGAITSAAGFFSCQAIKSSLCLSDMLQANGLGN